MPRTGRRPCSPPDGRTRPQARLVAVRFGVRRPQSRSHRSPTLDSALPSVHMYAFGAIDKIV